MTKNAVALPALILGIAALALAQTPPAAAPRQAAPLTNPTKIAIINIQAAILQTKEGQKASGDLAAKFTPRKSVLDKKQVDIQSLQDQLRKGSATLSDDAKTRLEKDIDTNTKNLQREAQDLNDDVDQEQGRMMNELGTKMMAVIEQYATQNGYAVVLDVSNQQSPILWAAASTNITPDIIRLYDLAHPETGSAAPAKPAAPAASRPPAAVPPRPVSPTAPPQKKQ